MMNLQIVYNTRVSNTKKNIYKDNFQYYSILVITKIPYKDNG